MTYRIASLCSGYGGLEMAVQAVIGGELAFVADNDPAAAALLEYRFPGVPNLGDIAEVDWSQVEPVDVLTAGFPCTDVSAAGQRAGLLHGNRSGVWHHVATAIAELRPSLVFIENVRGLLTARGDEPTEAHLRAEATRDACGRLVIWLNAERTIALSKGRRDRVRECSARLARVLGARKRAVARCQWHERRLVRAIGTVLGSLAGLGFDAEWVMLAASDVGAPHKRERILIVAWPAADAGGDGREGRQHPGGPGAPGRPGPAARRRGPARGDRASENPDGAACGQRGQPAPGQAESRRSRADAGGSGRAPASAADSERDGLARPLQPERRPERGIAPSGCCAGASADAECVGQPGRTSGGAGEADEPGQGSRAEAEGRCPAAADADRDGLPRGEERDEWPQFAQAVNADRRVDPLGRVLDWGIYEAAIRRWEAVTGRPAPAPTHPGRGGVPRLSPLLPEWMMGLPEGWVTDVPGLSGNDMLRLLGNGVVVQQAAAAYSLLLAAWLEAVEAA